MKSFFADISTWQIKPASFRAAPQKGEVGLVNNTAWMVKYGGWDPNPDDVIEAKGMAYLKKDVERDTHLTSVYQFRRQNIISRGWQISASKTDKREKIADFVRWNLITHLGKRSSNGFDGDLVGFMDAVARGFSLSELVWEFVNKGKYAGKWVIAALKKKDSEDYGFVTDKYGNILNIVYHGGYTGGIEYLKKNKFVHVIYGPDDENPYGESVSSKVAFWVWLKKNNAKFWAIFGEKFSMPLVIGKTPRNANPTDKNRVDNFIAELQTMSGLRVPEGFELSFLEAARRGDITYDNFIERCNKEISKIVIGATLGIEEGSKGQGSYAHASVNKSIMDIYTFFDEIMIAQAVNNQVIRPLVDYNFLGVEDYPSFSFNRNFFADLVSIAQGLEGFARMGVSVPVDWIYKRSGIPKPQPGEAVTKLLSSALKDGGKGTDNKTKQNYQFAEKKNKEDRELTKIEKRGQLRRMEKVLNALESDGLTQAAEILDSIFEKTQKAILKKLPEGEIIINIPKYSVNIGEFKKMLAAAALQYYLTGYYFAERELVLAGIKFATEKNVPLEIGTLEEAIKKFAKLISISKKKLQELSSFYKELNFTVAGITKRDIENIFDTLLISLKEGWTVADFTAAVAKAKIKYVGEIYGKELIDVPMNANHLQVIFRNNVMRAWRDGRNELFGDPGVAGEIWGYTYSAILDSRVRPSHAKLDGITRAKDDPFWQKYDPPWDHNCRCMKFAILKKDIATGKAIPTKDNEMPAMNPTEGFF